MEGIKKQFGNIKISYCTDSLVNLSKDSRTGLQGKIEAGMNIKLEGDWDDVDKFTNKYKLF